MMFSTLDGKIPLEWLNKSLDSFKIISYFNMFSSLFNISSITVEKVVSRYKSTLLKRKINLSFIHSIIHSFIHQPTDMNHLSNSAEVWR